MSAAAVNSYSEFYLQIFFAPLANLSCLCQQRSNVEKESTAFRSVYREKQHMAAPPPPSQFKYKLLGGGGGRGKKAKKKKFFLKKNINLKKKKICIKK